LAGRIKQISGAQISMHRDEKETFRTRYNVPDKFLQEVEKWFTMQGVPDEMLSGVRIPVRGFREQLPAEPDVLLNGGEVIPCGAFSLQVIHTPGHSPGHICLFEPTLRFLFTGDHILPAITPNVSLIPNSDGNPLGDFINSLLTVKKLDAKVGLPAHGNTFSNVGKRIDEIIKHHEKRNAEILKALKGGEKTPYQLADAITWMPEQGGVKHSSLSPIAKLAAVSETLAHLKAMSVEGKVTSENRDGIVYYKGI
jgi:glyoxylase-like metal-dependent hydrolase (beta-lactamase superfamily II)